MLTPNMTSVRLVLLLFQLEAVGRILVLAYLRRIWATCMEASKHGGAQKGGLTKLKRPTDDLQCKPQSSGLLTLNAQVDPLLGPFTAR